MNKWFGVNLFLLILALSVANAAATDIAYLVKNFNGVDSHLLDELTEQGYTYDIFYEIEFSSVDFSEYRLVVVGDQRLDTPQNVRLDLFPSLTINSENVESNELGWSGSIGTGTSPTLLTRNILSSSPIAEGLPQTFNAYTTSSPNLDTTYLAAQKPAGINIVYYWVGAGNPVIATLEPGRRFLNGRTLQERAVFFGATRPQFWTSSTRQAFRNSVEWAMEVADLDEDGFNSLVDCNDDDDSVYPGAEEIPYDGVDQDCDGEDLADVDGDGYDSEDVGGLDCDDSDFDVNPASSNLLNNCVNDEPYFVEYSETIFAFEGEVVEFVVIALDPEGDELFYSINDERFDVEGNIYSWQTGYFDAGENDFILTITDGENFVDAPLTIILENVNVPPTSLDIPPIVWEEDSAIAIDLDYYFADGDGDEIDYGIQSSSLGDEIFVEYVGDGVFFLTASENYFGEGWIVFHGHDGTGTAVSNQVSLIVSQVNDAPIFSGEIEDFRWNEDNSLENAFELDDYFSDIDSELSYGFYGNENIQITIEDGFVSFVPEQDFSGTEEIYFVASDGEYEVSSNLFLLEVENTGESPVLEELNCETQIDEDEEYSCDLSARDLDGDELSFSVQNMVHVNCEISGTTLTYSSEENYFGEASCLIRVTDGSSFDEANLELNILPVNDAPTIISASPPQSDVLIPTGRTKEFSVNVEDVDSNVVVKWYVGEEVVKIDNTKQSNYVFSRSVGEYDLRVEISDGAEEVEQSWNVEVKETTEFSCSEVGGNTCGGKNVCGGETISTNDGGVCCAVACIPSFEGANVCEIVSDELSLEIRDPDNNEEVEVGEDMRIEYYIDNDNSEDLDFDVEIFIYNLATDHYEEKIETTAEVEGGRARTFSTTFEVPLDLSSDSSYALFIKAEDNLCVQNYKNIRLKRQDSLVKIDKFEFPSSVECGQNAEGRITVQNYGDEEQDIYLQIKSNDLDLEFEDSFELEKYDEDEDRYSEKIDFYIPSEITGGIYKFEAVTNYGENRRERVEAQIEVICEDRNARVSEREIANSDVQESLILNSPVLQLGNLVTKPVSAISKMPLYFVISLDFMLFALVCVVYLAFRRR